ncbi:MAG: hypothetical protein OXI15_08045, partial [Chromatiales bacterium]|nr:hypothetical protein [Chromatiales bacterium]
MGWRRPARSSFGYPQGKSRGTSCADVVPWCRAGTQAFTRKKVDQGVFLRPAIKLRQPIASEQSISPSIRIAKCDASLIGNWNHLVAGAETGGEGRIQVPDHVAGRTRVEETVDDAMTPEVAAVHIVERIGINVDVAVGGGRGEGLGDAVGRPGIIALDIAGIAPGHADVKRRLQISFAAQGNGLVRRLPGRRPPIDAEYDPVHTIQTGQP